MMMYPKLANKKNQLNKRFKKSPKLLNQRSKNSKGNNMLMLETLKMSLKANHPIEEEATEVAEVIEVVDINKEVKEEHIEAEEDKEFQEKVRNTLKVLTISLKVEKDQAK